MIVEPKQVDIDAAFSGTNFGTAGETADGRRSLVAQCVLKRACGFSDGHTISTIAKELGLLTKKGTPKRMGKMWAYIYVTSPGLLRQNNDGDANGR